MSGYPANWRVYTQGNPVLTPRRRNIFFKGRRRSDRWMSRLVLAMPARTPWVQGYPGDNRRASVP